MDNGVYILYMACVKSVNTIVMKQLQFSMITSILNNERGIDENFIYVSRSPPQNKYFNSQSSLELNTYKINIQHSS